MRSYLLVSTYSIFMPWILFQTIFNGRKLFYFENVLNGERQIKQAGYFFMYVCICTRYFAAMLSKKRNLKLSYPCPCQCYWQTHKIFHFPFTHVAELPRGLSDANIATKDQLGEFTCKSTRLCTMRPEDMLIVIHINTYIHFTLAIK